jgi:tight adherence protein C
VVSVTPSLALGLLTGSLLGLGLWLIVSALPRVGRPRLTSRLAPYLADVSAEARDMMRPRDSDPGSIVASLIAPVTRTLASGLDIAMGGSRLVEARLRRSGSTDTVAHHRSRQLLGAALGAVCGAVIGLLAGREAMLGAPASLLGVFGGAAAGIIVVDVALARAASRRLERIRAELPTVVEFIALSVSAGESIGDALRRVSTVGSGEIAGEFARVISRVAAGQPLARSLAQLRDELEMPAISQLIDQMLAALERGTPLAEVLRAHALDAREDSRRRLIEAAGTREIAMLVPLVFLILPVTIVFALWPGLMVLQLGL